MYGKKASIIVLLWSSVALSGLSVAADSQQRETIKLWEDITPALEQALERQDSHDTLPDNAWFSADKTSNSADLSALLDEAVTVLIDPGGHGTNYRAKIRDLERAIQQNQQDIAALRRARISAPETALWQQSAADIDQDIANTEQRIEQFTARIAEYKRQFALELRALGLDISDEQLDFLLSTVIGDDIIGLGVAFDNVKSLTGQLEQLLVDSGEDLSTARRYYGMYTVLLGALEHVHGSLLGQVQRYLNELDSIEERTHTLLNQSRNLRRNADRHQHTLAANIEAQKLTLRTAKLYRQYLNSQAKDVADSRQRLARDIAVARNTYETVKVSGELVQMVHAGQNLLESLFARDVPAMFSFQNLELKREFEKLSVRLREAEPQ